MKKHICAFTILLTINSLAFSQTPSVSEIINKYLNAIGGKEKLETIQDVTLTSAIQIQGMTENIIAQKKNGKFTSTGTIDGMGEVEKWVCDGKKVLLTAMGQSKALDGKLLDLTLAQAAGIFPELYYDKIGISGQFLGTEKLNDRDVYKIEWSHTAGKWTDFFDAQTGLKIQQTAEFETPQGNIKTTNTFSNYKTVDGIRFPHTQTINNGMMDLTTNISKIELNKGLNDSLFEIN